MAVPVIASTEIGSGVTNAAINVNKPAGVAVGDVLVLVVSYRWATGVNTPSGYTLIRHDRDANNQGEASYYRVADGTEGASVSVTLTGGDANYGCVVSLSRVTGANATPIDAHGGTQSGVETTHPTAPSITTNGDDRLLLFVGRAGGNASGVVPTFAPPSGMTERWDNGNGSGNNRNALEGATETRASAGATGTRTATATNSASRPTGQNIAIAPAPAPAPTYQAAAVGKGSSTTPSVTLAPNTDDLILLIVQWQAASGSPTITSVPSGAELAFPVQDIGGQTYRRVAIYKKRAVAGDTVHGFELSASCDWIVEAVRFDGGGGPDKVYVVDIDAQLNTNTVNATAPSVTALTAGDVLLWIGADPNGRTYTPPSGMTERWDERRTGAQDISQSGATVAAGSAGATGTKTGTISAATDNVAFLVAISFSDPPNAPTLVSPTAAATIQRGQTNAFDWTFSDPDAGDTQSAWSLRRRPV